MKKFQKILFLFLAAVFLSSAFLLPAQEAEAANACICVQGSAKTCNKWTKITVETGKNWLSNKITFSQTKGKMNYAGNLFNENSYGAYTIKVTDHTTKKTTEYYWKYKANYTLKLKDNTTYTIQIKPYQPATVGDQNLGCTKSVVLAKASKTYNKNNWSWNSAPTWKIASTKAVNWCYSSL